jgi:uncharacterized protein YndB with AHSA1/START domain
MSSTAKVTVSTPSDREIAMTRQFNAPRELIFDCYTKPELLKRWLHGPEGWLLDVCDNDATVGSAYRWVWRHAHGHEMGMRGVYLEIVRPKRIVRTEIFDQDWTGGEAVGTLALSEKDGKTVVTTTVLYASREARDGALKSGMEKGVNASFDRLEALLSNEAPRSRNAA